MFAVSQFKGKRVAMFGLARSGVAVPKEYFEVYGENVAAYTAEHGGVLLNPGAPAWNGELGSGFRYIYPAWKNTPPPETGRLSPSWSQDGAEWVLDFGRNHGIWYYQLQKQMEGE